MLEVTATEVYKDPTVAQMACLSHLLTARAKQAICDLVNQGVDINSQGDLDTSLLQWAFWNKNIDGMRALLEEGANPALIDDSGQTVMHYAAGIDDPVPLQTLLDAGVAPDVCNENGQTPIFEAIWNDCAPQFQALLGAGADVNAQGLAGSRPLHLAAKFSAGCVLPLLEAGADPLAVDGNGRTFQYYLNVKDESIATDSFIKHKRDIEAWLVQHGVGLEREHTHHEA